MNLIKVFLIQFTVFIFIFLIFNRGFSQVKTGEMISFPGVIQSIQKDFKFIVINEVRIFISRDTKVVDENGNILKINVLKPRLNVSIETLRNPNGIFAKKIMIKGLKK